MRIKIFSLLLALLAVECSGKEDTSPIQSYIYQDTYTNTVLGLSAIKGSDWTFISEAERSLDAEFSDPKNADLHAFVRAHMTKPFLVITKPREISPQPTLTALIAPLNSRMTTDPVANLQSMATSGAKAFEDYRIVVEPHSTEIGGCQGAYCKATYTLNFQNGETAPVSFESWHIVSGENYYLIGVVSRQPEDENTAKEIKDTISSFKIASQPTRPARAPVRMLMHIFQDDSNLMSVAIIDRPVEFNGVARPLGDQENEHSFTVSHTDFEKLWTTLMATEAPNCAGATNHESSFDGVNNYIFSAASGPRSNTNYVVPVGKASPALTNLANQFRAYAH